MTMRAARSDDLDWELGCDAAAFDADARAAGRLCDVQHVVVAERVDYGRRRDPPRAARLAERVIVRVDDARAERDARAGQRDDA